MFFLIRQLSTATAKNPSRQTEYKEPGRGKIQKTQTPSGAKQAGGDQSSGKLGLMAGRQSGTESGNTLVCLHCAPGG